MLKEHEFFEVKRNRRMLD